MAFKREKIASDEKILLHPTVSPIEEEDQKILNRTSETTDSQQVQFDYAEESSVEGGKVDTGALIPRDMTVKLVRSESANWEVFLTFLYTFTLTFFGIFLGSWITKNLDSTLLEKIATIALGVISVVLIFAWALIKHNQRKSQVKIPGKILESYGNQETEPISNTE